MLRLVQQSVAVTVRRAFKACPLQAWELAADPRISVGEKKKCPPQKIKRSAQVRM